MTSQTPMEHEPGTVRPVAAADSDQPHNRRRQRIIRRGIVFLLLAGTIGGVLQMKFDLVNALAVRFFGPPQVELREAYANTESTVPFDHSLLDKLLRVNVDADGWVDYASVRNEEEQLDAYLASVAEASLEDLGRNDRLAFLINSYNAFTLKLILEHYPLESIKEIPTSLRWDAARWNLAGQTVSLSQIEHELIRPKFVEPRIHFALVCAAVGCPPLRNEVYTGDRLEAQLAGQTTYVHHHATWFQFDNHQDLRLTELYNWYGGDFEQAAGSILNFVSQYAPELKDAVSRGTTPLVTWLPYDWRLNDIRYTRNR